MPEAPSNTASGCVLLLEGGAEPAEIDNALSRHGLSCLRVVHDDPWWTDRAPGARSLAAEQRVVEAAESARHEWGDRASIGLLGFGPAGHGALRIAYKRARDFPVVAAWRPAIDCHTLLDGRLSAPPEVTAQALRDLAARYPNAEACRQDSALLHIHPLGWPRWQWIGCPQYDPWWEGFDRLRMKLRSLGVPFDEAPDDPPNDSDPALADRVASWIAEKLAAESRRVP